MAYPPTHPRMYVTGQPVVGNPFQQLNGEWNVGLCECCENISQCAYAYFCYCCFVRSLRRKIDEPCLSGCCVPNALGAYRMKVRSVLRIRGDSLNDHCVTCLMPCCAALQMKNELISRGIA